MQTTRTFADIILRQSHDIISIVGPDYRYRYTNPAYEYFFGVSTERLQNSLVSDILGTDVFTETVKPNLDRGLAGEAVRYQAWFNMPALGCCYMDVQYSPLLSEDGAEKAVVVVSKDITQWKRAEEAAIQAEHRLSMALKAAKAAVWQWDTRTNFCSWSDETFRLLGYEPGSVVPSYETWLNALHPDDRNRVHGQRTKALAADEDLAIEYRVRWPNGEVHWVQSIAQTLRDWHGKPTGMTGISLDITARKQAEAVLEQAKRDAEHANQGKSSFLAAASHDLRQPFQAMRLFHQVLETRCDESLRPVVKHLGMAMANGEELLSSLLDISTLDACRVEAKMTFMDIGPILSEVVADCISVAEAAKLRLVAMPCRAVIKSDRVLLKRMIRNLLVNSIRYTKEGGIVLGCRYRGGHLVIQVVDTGIGIARERQELIFENFYQIDNPGRESSQGMGLGLAIVNRLSKLLDHPVSVASRLGCGSVFSIQVPLVGRYPALPEHLEVVY